MDRRGFLACGSALATATAFAPAAASANKVPAPAERGSRVNFIWDGLGLNPNEYAAQLQQAVAARDFAADYYSLGGAIAALEQKFAAVLGKEAAMFVPTGTLANHLAVRKLAGNNRRVALLQLYSLKAQAAGTECPKRTHCRWRVRSSRPCPTPPSA